MFFLFIIQSKDARKDVFVFLLHKKSEDCTCAKTPRKASTGSPSPNKGITDLIALFLASVNFWTFGSEPQISLKAERISLYFICSLSVLLSGIGSSFSSRFLHLVLYFSFFTSCTLLLILYFSFFTSCTLLLVLYFSFFPSGS